MEFDGSILVRAQQPTAVTQLLNRKQPPTPKERNELLSFLASIVLSGKSGLRFDPTVPPNDLEVAKEACSKLNMDGVSIGQPEGADTESIAKASCIAFQQAASSENLLKLLKEPPAVSSRFPSAQEKEEDITKFVREFSRIQELSEDQGALIQLGHDLSKPRSKNAKLWGNKLLAGMALAQADYLKITSQLKLTPDLSELKSPVEQPGLFLKQSNSLDLNYRLISAMIVNFRDYLMPSIAGQYGCIYSSAKSIDYLGRLKFNQLAVLDLLRQLRTENYLSLGELQERLKNCDMESSFATRAMANVGAHVLQKADPREGQHGLVTAALTVAENDQFSALLKWVAKRQSAWEDSLSDNIDLQEEAFLLNEFVEEKFRELQDPRESVVEIARDYTQAITVGGASGLIGLFALTPILAVSAGVASAVFAQLASRSISSSSNRRNGTPQSTYLGALDLTVNEAIPAKKIDERLKDIWR